MAKGSSGKRMILAASCLGIFLAIMRATIDPLRVPDRAPVSKDPGEIVAGARPK